MRSRRALLILAALPLLASSPGVASAQGWPSLEGPAAEIAVDDEKVTPVRVFRIEGRVSEADPSFDLFDFSGSFVFGDLLAALDRESRRPGVRAIVVRLASVDLGIAQAQELAGALRRARERKRAVIVHLESASVPHMMVATAADEVHLTPEGSVFLTGLRAEVAYYRDLLDTLGVDVDLEEVGRYKSAAEPYTRTSMSDAAREQLEALLDSLYNTTLRVLGAQRRLTIEAVGDLIDVGLFTADDAKRRGLVDHLSYWRDLRETLAKRFGGAPTLAFPIIEDGPDLGSIFSILELLTRAPREPETGRPRIALVSAEGPIVSGRNPGDLLSSRQAIASEELIAVLEEIERDPTIKAVVLRIDSPGGSALASDVIWRAVTRINKQRPVVASLGNVAASGGYYIASAARRIVASEGTITGSIGVFGGKMVIRRLMDKIGVHTVVLNRGRHAGMLSPMARFTDSERAVFRQHMEHTYSTFVNRVRAGRGMSYDAVHRVGQGRIWTGEQAHAVGLVDRLGGLHDAIAEAARLAHLSLDDVDIVKLPRKQSFLEMLSRDPARLAAPRQGLPFGLEALPAAMRERVLGAITLLDHLLGREPALALVPYDLRIR